MKIARGHQIQVEIGFDIISSYSKKREIPLLGCKPNVLFKDSYK